jgi:hypothetical protein
MARVKFSCLFCGETDEPRQFYRMATQELVPRGKIICLEG